MKWCCRERASFVGIVEQCLKTFSQSGLRTSGPSLIDQAYVDEIKEVDLIFPAVASQFHSCQCFQSHHTELICLNRFGHWRRGEEVFRANFFVGEEYMLTAS